jgi:hypothetical protein
MVHKICHSSYEQYPCHLKELDFRQHQFPRRREHSRQHPEKVYNSMADKSRKFNGKHDMEDKDMR